MKSVISHILNGDRQRATNAINILISEKMQYVMNESFDDISDTDKIIEQIELDDNMCNMSSVATNPNELNEIIDNLVPYELYRIYPENIEWDKVYNYFN